MTRIFFRDDDVGDLTEPLERFVSLFLERELPVNYQVVPEFLTDAGVNFIVEKQRSNSNLIRLNQHGLKHSQLLKGKHSWSEFAGGRPYEDQLRDIQTGRQILEERFGSSFDGSIFTPPQHKYDRNTLKALKATGFETLSASYYPNTKNETIYRVGKLLGFSSLQSRGISRHGETRSDCGLYELSVSVFADDGSHRVEKLEALLEQVSNARSRVNDVGVMLHHPAWVTEKDFDFLNRFLDQLQQMEDVSFHSMNDLVPKS
ncbi:hypothetical protein KOR42_33930 [Thalassoglobus neptunius]|uniref:Polysaccharide deacetylase n=1 Tax=Thalassoglobus neptunius TaxID=1938619 RepID=A0A5C5WM68_9PLAN|nr:DUF2334 domain-containing protein [Thalassoglobus neptunius]TWT51707.1 hypothetical protein KOR42_33930 [Thalassoglobus neptunius]